MFYLPLLFYPLPLVLLFTFCVYVCRYMGILGASQVVPVAKNLPASAGDRGDVVRSLGREDPLEEGVATHSSILAWRIPWTEELGRLQSMGLHMVRHVQLSPHGHAKI